MTEFGPEHRLATYGTLAPGRGNHHHVSDLAGRWWFTGSANGILYEEGWGSDQGCPGMVPSPEGEAIAVHILEASDLPAYWDRLDAFEGDEYQRVIVPVKLDGGETLDCSIYALRRSP
ncbi:MAG: gamma-glutamylcyclotransferase family protein [Pseudomonadota bacterium]